jgi:hypothetical protein
MDSSARPAWTIPTTDCNILNAALFSWGVLHRKSKTPHHYHRKEATSWYLHAQLSHFSSQMRFAAAPERRTCSAVDVEPQFGFDERPNQGAHLVTGTSTAFRDTTPEAMLFTPCWDVVWSRPRLSQLHLQKSSMVTS